MARTRAIHEMTDRQFSHASVNNVQRSAFRLSHDHLTTFNAGYLVPFYTEDVLPGDHFKVDCSVFGRLATPIAPIMDRLKMDTFFFAVPYRLLWDKWERFNGERINPKDTIDFTCPTITAPAVGGYVEGSLGDYFGMPTGVDNLKTNAFYHRAYNLIYNEYFRDENLQDSVPFNSGDGPDNAADYPLLKRSKRHDYFTSCLPFPQKGGSVDLPLGGKAAIRGLGVRDVPRAAGQSYSFAQPGDLHYEDGKSETLLGWRPGNAPGISAGETGISGSLLSYVAKAVSPTSDRTKWTWDPAIYADLGGASSATIADLRQSFAIQHLLELDARGGTRYTEILRSHFGVHSKDGRLQRPEFLGGHSTECEIMPVPQTSSTDAKSPQGNLSGYGTFGGYSKGFRRYFEEHMVVIGLVCVYADLSYQQGLHRKFSRSTRYDFYLPSFAHLSEQAVLNKEIYADGGSSDDLVFGYQQRFAEYKYHPSLVTGKFRSSAAGTLDVWHLSQKFANLPKLNSEFITENPPVDRIIAVPSEPHVLFDSHLKIKAVRPMPLNAIPGLNRL